MGEKISLAKEETALSTKPMESSMVGVGHTEGAVVSGNYTYTEPVERVSLMSKIDNVLGGVTQKCPECGHAICICSLRKLTHGDQDNYGL